MALPPMICGMQQFMPLQSPTGPVHIPQAHRSVLETQWLYHFHHTKTEGMVAAMQQSGTVPLPVPVGTQVGCLKLYPRFSWFQQMLMWWPLILFSRQQLEENKLPCRHSRQPAHAPLTFPLCIQQEISWLLVNLQYSGTLCEPHWKQTWLVNNAFCRRARFKRVQVHW